MDGHRHTVSLGLEPSVFESTSGAGVRNIIIDGFIIEGASKRGIAIYGPANKNGPAQNPTENITIRNVIGRNGGNVDTLGRLENVVIEYCEFYNTGTGINFNWLGADFHGAEPENDMDAAHNCVVRNCLVHDNVDIPPGGTDGIAGSYMYRCTFENNVVWHNSDDGIDMMVSYEGTVKNNISFNNGVGEGNGCGIKFSARGGGRHTITGNVVLSNSKLGLEGSQPGTGNEWKGYYPSKLYNNLAYNSGECGLSLGTGEGYITSYPGFDKTYLRNNIAVDNATDMYCGGPSVTDSDYNFFSQAENINDGGLDVHSLTGDPELANKEVVIDTNLDPSWTIEQKLEHIRSQVKAAFSLATGSPLADAGTIVSGYHNPDAGDASGEGRAWYGIAPDIGAYEVALEDIDDLSVSGVGQNSATITWTAPGGQSYRAATYCDIRYAEGALTEAGWDAATQVEGEPEPGDFGDERSFTISGLDPGTPYHIAVKTGDELGNISWLSNVVAATTTSSGNHAPVLQPIGDQSVAVGGTLSFLVSATDADAADTLTYSAADVPSGAAFDPATRTFTWTPTENQAGTHLTTFEVTDGHVTVSETITITVQGSSSHPPVLDAIGNQAVGEGSHLGFTVSATDADGDPITYSATGLPSGATFSGQDFSWTPDYDQAGSYEVTFTASDGELEDSETVTVTVSNTNRAPTLASIGNKSVDENAVLDFSISATDLDGDSITYSTTGLPTGATFADQAFNWTPSYDQAGPHSVTFAASDGTLEDSEAITITVANVNRAPVLTSIGSKSGNENTLLSFTIGATDADADSITYSASGLPSGANFADRVFSWTPTYEQAGSYSVTFSASDGTLDDSEVVTITVANVNRAPELAGIGSKSVNENAALNFTVSATDADGDEITYSATGLPTGATFANQQFDWTPTYDQSGSYSITFAASDGTVEDSETVAVTVANVNRAPELAPIGNKSVDENVFLSFTISATDADEDALTYSATGLPTGAIFTDQTFSWTPDGDQAGNYSVTFTASDGTAEDSETITITAGNVDRPPELAAIGNKSVDEKTLLSFTISATDPDDDALTYSATGLPSGATLSGQDFSWTPSYDQAGSYDVTFTASDGTLEDSEAITITVENVNRAPELATIGNKSVDENTLLSFTISATDADDDSITYSATGLPAGATLTGQSFSWTPTHDQAGNHSVTFTASDGTAEDSETITVTVGDVADETPPSASDFLPEADAIQVPLNSLIALTVSDAGLGVDANTVTLQVNNELVYSGDNVAYQSAYGVCRRKGTPASYRYSYQPISDFDFDQKVSVRVAASDLAHNVMTPVSYQFTTEMRAFGDNQVASWGPLNRDKSSPATTRDSAGNIWLAYHAGPAGQRDIYIAKLGAGDSNFAGPTQLTTDASDQSHPSLAIGSDDKLYVVWQDNRRGDWDVYARTSADGVAWSAETRVSDSNDNQTAPAVVVDTQSPNRAYVAWQDDGAGNADIYVADSSNDFAAKTVARVTSDSSDQTAPAIAVDTSNTVYVVWTDRRNGSDDIYGATSAIGPWANVAVATGAGSQSLPDIATEESGSVLHFVWVDDSTGNADVRYASSDGMPAGPLTGTNIADDTSGADQTMPSIITTGSTGDGLKVFAGWQDHRNVNSNGQDTDLYFVEIRTGDETNILVGDGGTRSNQSEPVIGVDDHEYPYLVWTDDRNLRTQIYYAGSTLVDPDPLASQSVIALLGGTAGTTPAVDAGDVSVTFPAGALPDDVTVTISHILNPQSPPGSLRALAYDFGPSGLHFSQPVSITIPYAIADYPDGSPVPCWYDTLTGTFSQQDITDIEVLELSDTLNAMRFSTTHFTSYLLLDLLPGGGDDDGSTGGSSGGGGCALSPSSGDAIDFILPYLGLAAAMIVLRRRDRKVQRT